MANLFKWIGGFVGFTLGGPLGLLLGVVVGSVIDSASNAEQPQPTNENQQQRSTFLFSLLVLVSYIIRADGKVMHSEMEVVRLWLRQNFGEEAKVEGEDILRKLFDEQKRLGPEVYRSTVISSCNQIRSIMSYEQRLQLLNFLALVAKADGNVVPEELKALYECATAMGLSQQAVDSMLNLDRGASDLDAAYKVLGVSPSATDAEVKAAYRKMALANHPDKVASLGEDVRKAAEKKFQEINAAKETIWKARGM